MTQRRAVIDLPATVGAAATARHLVAELLRSWTFPTLADDARLVISELVSNAYRHAPGGDSFELEITAHTGGNVRISVADGSAVRPLIRELDSGAPSGRGMRLVEALVSEWGAEDYHGGKRVWVHLTPRDPVVPAERGDDVRVEISAVDVKKTLLGLRWPTTAAALLDFVVAGGAPEEIVEAMRSLPPGRYGDANEVLAALSRGPRRA